MKFNPTAYPWSAYVSPLITGFQDIDFYNTISQNAIINLFWHGSRDPKANAKGINGPRARERRRPLYALRAVQVKSEWENINYN